MTRLLISLTLGLLLTLQVQAQKFSTHEVKQGETITSIAKRYSITPRAIYALNPDAKTKLRPNTILIIPLSKKPASETTFKHTLQGFKKHRVRRKQTLYSLAKAYNITEDDIKKYNKYLYSEPLRRGDKIQIPVFKRVEVQVTKSATQPYTVLPKEGKWRIAYKYGITEQELEALNPGMHRILQVGDVIQVPNISPETQQPIDDAYSYYKVKPKQGFYRLKAELGLTQDTLEALNPNLKSSGLKAGMILKIPRQKKALTPTQHTAIDLKKRGINSSTQKHIAVLLPFRLDKVHMDSMASSINSIKKDPYLDASLDFYSGIRLALDSLKAMGISLKVDVYDTKNSTTEVSNIIQDNDFQNLDAVIGPLTSKNFRTAALALQKYRVPIIAPTGSNRKLYSNVFQSIPPSNLLKETLINYIKNKIKAQHVIIIADSKNSTVANELKTKFSGSKIIYSKTNDGKDENYVLLDDLKNALKPGENVVFLETSNEGLVSNITSILASLTQTNSSESTETQSQTNITLSTTNYNRAFQSDAVSNEHLSKLHLLFPSSSKYYDEAHTPPAITAYKRKYSSIPSERAIKGFDLTMDVVLRLSTSANLYQSINEAPSTEYLENKFTYTEQPQGGYYNTAVYLLQYNNLAIVPLEK